MAPAATQVTHWDEALRLIKEHGYHRSDEPFKLASGQMSHDYIDGKLAIDTGRRLRVISEAMLELAGSLGINFTHVGGLTMGADPLAHGLAMVDEKLGWFSVRKEPKQRGLNRYIEGSRLVVGDRVLLVDDVVTSGGSIVQAFDKVIEAGAEVVGVMPMVDRGEAAAQYFHDRGIPYRALVTYSDLGIEPVGGANRPTPAV